MARKNWNRWFFASTRGQIITLLRRSSRTVDELAQALDLQLLDQLLDVLTEHLPADKVETLLREVGRRMAAQWKIPPGELHVRLEAAAEVLNELGGLMERETEGETLCIIGYRCPFAAAVRKLS